MNITEVSELIALARPIDESDYASERQVNLENQVYHYLETVLTPQQLVAFERYSNKANVNERLDAALYVVNGDVAWLERWQ
jgi:hypothetical protein